MKALLFFLFLPISLMGQEKPDSALLAKIDSVSAEWRKEFLWRDSLGAIRDSISPKIDTVEIWMLCADTSGTGFIGRTATLKGWEVTKTYWVDDHWQTEDNGDSMVYYPARWRTDHVAYLNHFKQPLTGYIVWQTKEINSKNQ